MHGSFVWNELATIDLERAKAFYSVTLGWSYEAFPLPEGTYWIAKLGGQPIAGICGLEAGAVQQEAPYWFGFIEVDDVDTRVAMAVANGGSIVRPAEDVPDVGRIAVVRDPTGAAIGWMTSAQSEAAQALEADSTSPA